MFRLLIKYALGFRTVRSAANTARDAQIMTAAGDLHHRAGNLDGVQTTLAPGSVTGSQMTRR
jgi:hypothetical protein